MQQQGIENARVRNNEAKRVKRQKDSAEIATLVRLEAAGGELAPEEQARLEDLRSAKKSKSEADRVRYHKNSEELAKLKQLEEDGVELNDVQQAKLEDLRSTKKRKNEASLSRYYSKRQKRVEEAGKHPMLKLLVTSNKISSSKLIAIINDGTLKKVLTSYFVPQQKMKFADKFINTVDGCEGVTRFLANSILDNHIPDLSTMKNGISSKTPLSTDNSTHAQQIILQLFPE
jgi:hypothetical protein